MVSKWPEIPGLFRLSKEEWSFWISGFLNFWIFKVTGFLDLVAISRNSRELAEISWWQDYQFFRAFQICELSLLVQGYMSDILFSILFHLLEYSWSEVPQRPGWTPASTETKPKLLLLLVLARGGDEGGGIDCLDFSPNLVRGRVKSLNLKEYKIMWKVT